MEKSALLNIADTLSAIADGIRASCEDGQEPAPPVPTVQDKPKVSLEQVRGALAEKSQKGFTADVKALIRKYGAERLSDIDPQCYPDMLKEAEGIGNA